MSQEFLVDIHVNYNDNGEFHLVFLTNKSRYSRLFRKQDKLIAVFTGLLALQHRFEDALQSRAAEHSNGAESGDGALCKDCGKSPVMPGYDLCEECGL